jgi:mannobiose 2-epimerase
LHILEAYTNLYRVWSDSGLKKQIENLIKLFLSRFVDNTGFHMQLFFTENWEPRHQIVSYGHDIEASWLIYEAALVINNHALLSKTESVILNMASACFEGLQPDGSMAYELNRETEHLDSDRHWWVQAETVVGYVNAFQLSQNGKYLEKAAHCWQYIKNRIIDHSGGEWFWSVYSDGTVNRNDDKLGIWKCPYHNGRMCLEVIERFEKNLLNQ